MGCFPGFSGSNAPTVVMACGKVDEMQPKDTGRCMARDKNIDQILGEEQGAVQKCWVGKGLNHIPL